MHNKYMKMYAYFMFWRLCKDLETVVLMSKQLETAVLLFTELETVV